MSEGRDMPFERIAGADPRTRFWIRRGYAASLLRAGVDRPEEILGNHSTSRSGRGPVAFLDLPGRPGEQAVLKRYRRGGFAGKVLPSWFFGVGRFRRELRIVEEAVRRGVPTPQSLGLIRRGRWGIYRVYGITRRIPGARNLLELLDAPVPEDRRREWIRCAARTVREFQDRGLHHGDLNLGNLLVSPAGSPEPIHVVDLGGSRLLPTLSLRRRRRVLKRLRRSWEKQMFLRGRRSGSEVARFLLEYGAGDRGLLRSLRRWSYRDRFLLFLHRMGWNWNRRIP